MPVVRQAEDSGRWFHWIVIVSALLVVITFASYAFEGPGRTSMLLFRFGLGGENNVGAWWSGMLLLFGAVLALDGYCNGRKSVNERRGWLALAAALVLMSVDEISGLHEHLANRGLLHLVPLGVLGLSLAGYAMVQLHRAQVPRRTFRLLLGAFGLLATIPVQEIVQHSFAWPNPLVYGVRGMLEEGAELTAMLLFIAAARANAAELLAAGGDVLAAARHRSAVLIGSAVLIVPLTAAANVLPYAGPVDWLAASLYMGCALLVARGVVLQRQTPGLPAVVLFGGYLLASAATNAVKIEWDPVIFGWPISARGIVTALLLLVAVEVLRANGRPVSRALFALAALVTAAAAALQPQSQILWGVLPVAVALGVYAIESKAALAAVPFGRVAEPLNVPAAALPRGPG